MADTVSVAGSAVGVISLAITTCQGVISYYDSWETQDQNISDTKRKIQRLQSSLSALEEILPKISSSSAIAEHVKQCVLCCGEGTARLEHFFGKMSQGSCSAQFQSQIPSVEAKSYIPFRKSSLDRLREIVRDLEGDLGNCAPSLATVCSNFRSFVAFKSANHPNSGPTSDTSEAQFRQTSDLIDLTKSTAASVSEANQNISSMEQNMNMVIYALPQLQIGVARFTSDVPMLRSSLTSMKQDLKRRLQAIEGVTSQILPDFQEKLDRLPLQIQGSLAESTTSARLRPMVETSDPMSTALTDMVLLFDEYHFNSADDLSGRGRTKAPTRSSSEGQLTTYCLR